MNKSSQTQNKTKFYMIMFLASIFVIGFLIWFFQGVLGFKTTKINLTGVLPARTANKTDSMYDNYGATYVPGAAGAYYTKLKDVICDAADNPDGSKGYYRISVTFESPDEKSAKKLIASSKTLVADLRGTVSSLTVDNANQPQVMSYIKADMQRKIKEKFGTAAVTDIYFEEILSQ